MQRFPKKIYLNIEEPDTENEFFRMYTTIEDLPGEDQKIAIYELKEIKNLINKRELK